MSSKVKRIEQEGTEKSGGMCKNLAVLLCAPRFQFFLFLLNSAKIGDFS
jgi:hypothetical protein